VAVSVSHGGGGQGSGYHSCDAPPVTEGSGGCSCYGVQRAAAAAVVAAHVVAAHVVAARVAAASLAGTAAAAAAASAASAAVGCDCLGWIWWLHCRAL